MIDINDLMKGDWINLNYDIDYKTSEPIYTPVQVTGINADGTVDVDFTLDKSESMKDGWDPKLIEPLPLTVDIIKKNFHCYEYYDDYWTQEHIGHCDIHTNLISSCRIHYRYYTRDNNYYEYIKAGLDIDRWELPLKYVHQLQHFLKLVEYKEEIKL